MGRLQTDRDGRLRDAWTDRCWPVLTGAVLGTGVATSMRIHGADLTLLVFVGLASFLVLLTHGVLVGAGESARPAWRIGSAGGAVVVAGMGLVELPPVLTMPLVLACVVTSPPVVSRAWAAWAAARARWTPRRRPPRSFRSTIPSREPSQAAVDRTFARLVEQLRSQTDQDRTD